MAHKALIVERDVEVEMRDGVHLYADVYRADTSQPLPTLLQRTPYGKGFAQTSFALMAAERGYAVVVQDTRGRWASEGDGYPMLHEMEDGYDSVEWAAAQPWSDGKVGMFGASYVGYTQLAAAVLHPPALVTIIPSVTFCSPYEIFYRDGALALGVGVSWNLVSGGMMTIMRHSGDEAQKERLMGELIAAVDGMVSGETFDHLPLNELPLLGQDGLTPFLYDIVAHPTPDEYWQRLVCPYADVDIPVFHVGGWYDIFINNTLNDFVGIQEKGNTQQKVLIGPWVHAAINSYVGDVDFGVQASGLYLVPDELQLRWFDYWLKGVDNGVSEEAPIRLFVMGENVWRDENEWPLARTQYTPYYLHSGGAANSRHGDGSLSPEPAGQEAVDSFVYDPRHPVPTRGGGLCCWQAALAPGAFDQREIEDRPDVLVYTTAPLGEDVEVTGPIEVHLWATTSAPDTDFTAKLVDVGPCGYARNVQDGIVRARYRTSPTETEPVQPGEITEYIIDVGNTGNVFKAGHRIRLEIASSNFPRFARNTNTNTGQALDAGTEVQTALQTVWHDTEHPSHILLPIIPR